MSLAFRAPHHATFLTNNATFLASNAMIDISVQTRLYEGAKPGFPCQRIMFHEWAITHRMPCNSAHTGVPAIINGTISVSRSLHAITT